MEEEADLEWLPDHVAEKIRSIKRAEEDYRMRYLFEEYSEERLSRHTFFRLSLDSYEFPSNSIGILRDARILRNELTYLEIKFYADIQERSMINSWVTCFINLLKRLKHSPLQYLEINNLWFLFYRVGNPDARIIYDRIYEAIITFLESQRQLQIVKIIDCMFTYEDNKEIVEMLVKNQNINKICFECDSFTSFREDELSEREEILPLLNRLQNLRVLLIDYSCVLGDHADPDRVVGLIKSFQNLTFLRIFLRVSSFSSNFKRFESRQWRNLEEKPNLEIEISIITNAEHRQQNESFIVNDMPVKYVCYTLSEESPVNEFDLFVQYLVSRGVNDHLKILCLKLLPPNIPNLNSVLTTFVSRCRKLEVLFLTVEYPQNRIEDLAEYLAHHSRIRDIWFYIIGDVSEENKRRLEDVAALLRDRLEADDRSLVIELTVERE